MPYGLSCTDRLLQPVGRCAFTVPAITICAPLAVDLWRGRECRFFHKHTFSPPPQSEPDYLRACLSMIARQCRTGQGNQFDRWWTNGRLSASGTYHLPASRDAHETIPQMNCRRECGRPAHCMIERGNGTVYRRNFGPIRPRLAHVEVDCIEAFERTRFALRLPGPACAQRRGRWRKTAIHGGKYTSGSHVNDPARGAVGMKLRKRCEKFKKWRHMASGVSAEQPTPHINQA